MESKVSKQNMIAGVAGLLMTAAIITALFTYSANKNLKNDLSTEKLSSEKLLAEKLLLDKEIVQFNKQIAQINLDMNDLKGKNTDLDKMLAISKTTLTKKESELKRLIKDNAGKKSIEKDLTALKKINMGYTEEINTLKNQIKSYAETNAALNTDNNSLKQKMAALEAKNKELIANNMVPKKLSFTDAYLVEGLKGKKEKLTLNARRTKKLTLYFNVPDELTSNLNFRIIAPDGKKVQKKDKAIVTTVLDQIQKARTNDNQPTIAMALDRRIKMEYSPLEKFQKGIYKIEIFNNDEYLNSCQVHLK